MFEKFSRTGPHAACLLTGRAERVDITVTSSANGGDANYRVDEYEDDMDKDPAPPSSESCEEFWWSR